MIKPLNKQALSRRFMAGIAPVLLLGCSTVPMSPGSAFAQDSSAVELEQNGVSMDSQLMFELMVAELAGRRGQLDVALAGYLRASEKTTDPRVSERATRLAIYGRQWPEAEIAARRWQSLDPVATDVSPMLAQTLLHQEKLTEAADEYVSIIEASSDQDTALRQTFTEIQGLDDPQQSVEIMQQVMQAFPENVQSHLGLAQSQMLADEQTAALASIDDALTIDPLDTGALLLRSQILIVSGQPDEGFDKLRTALQESPEDNQLRLGYAQLLVEAGRYDDVGEQLDSLASAADGDPNTLLRISLLALDSRRIERARDYLTQLLATGQHQDQANFYIARINDQQQDYQTAIRHYDAVESGDLQVTAQIRAAELLGITGELAKGRERLHQLAAVVSNPAMQPKLITAESRMLQSAGQPVEAVKVLTEALDRFQGDGDLLYARALAAEASGNDAMMVDDLSQLIKTDPNNAHALNALGYHFADNNIELEKAEELLVKANALLPDDPAIKDSLGWLRYRQGKMNEAIDLLTSAYKLFPDAEIAAHLGEALWLNGKESEARKLLEEALLVSPDDDKLQQVMQKYSE